MKDSSGYILTYGMAWVCEFKRMKLHYLEDGPNFVFFFFKKWEERGKADENICQNELNVFKN